MQFNYAYYLKTKMGKMLMFWGNVKIWVECYKLQFTATTTLFFVILN